MLEKPGQQQMQQGQGQQSGDGGEGGGQEVDVEKLVNTAISNHLSRFKGHISKEVTDMVGKAIAPLAEQLQALAQAREAQSAAGGDGKQATTAEQRALEQERVKQENRIKTLEAKLAAEATAREQEHTTRLQQEERAALQKALVDVGVSSLRLPGALALLYTEKKLVARDSEGQIGFKVKGPVGEEIAPLADGVVAWAKTDEGKDYLATRPVQGGGVRPGAPAGSKQDPKAQKIAEARAKLAEMFGYSNPNQ
jgi:hypothetical protein